MRVLIAEDDPISKRVLQSLLRKWEFEVQSAGNGLEAWEVLQQEDAPSLAILDWMMPGMDGPEVCRRLRALAGGDNTYVILLTARGETGDIVTGLEAGANDYLTKPFKREELRARLQVGLRMLDLQQRLAERVKELEDALAHVRQLQGILPICTFCKRVRDDGDYWQQVEAYISARSDARFSHGICPECWDARIQPELDNLAGAAPGS